MAEADPSGGLVCAEDFVGDGIHLSESGHGFEDLEVGLDPRPLLWIFLGGDGGERVGVEVFDVSLELDGDRVGWVPGQLGEKPCVGSVGEGVAAGFDDDAGVEVAVGDVVIDAVVVDHDVTQGLEGVIDTADVEVFCLLGWTFDGEHLEDTNFGNDVDEAGVEMASEAGGLSVLLPVVFGGYLEKLVPELKEIFTGTVLGEGVFVEDCLRSGDIGKEAADGVSVDAYGGLFAADDVGKTEAVGLVEGGAEQGAGNFEADVFEICGGSEAGFAELIDVEGKLGLDVGVGALGVIDDGAVFLF